MLGELHLGTVGIIITFLWIIGLTNAYNFMDGIDGMAGGVALSAGIAWMWLASNMHNVFALWIALAITASSLGFLAHNWSPAKIFMGDVGSTFLGYSFAVLPLMTHTPPAAGRAAALLPLAALLLVWPFAFDSGTTFFRRLLRGENVFAAHRSHLYQRLVRAGETHRNVSSLYMGLALSGLLLAVGWALSSAGNGVAVALGVLALCGALWCHVVLVE